MLHPWCREAAGTTGAQLLYFHSTNLQGNGMRETTQIESSENDRKHTS